VTEARALWRETVWNFIDHNQAGEDVREAFDCLVAEREAIQRKLEGLERWAGEQNAGNAFATQVRAWALSMLSGEELDEP
jgi:hypothetical protein